MSDHYAKTDGFGLIRHAAGNFTIVRDVFPGLDGIDPVAPVRSIARLDDGSHVLVERVVGCGDAVQIGAAVAANDGRALAQAIALSTSGSCLPAVVHTLVVSLLAHISPTPRAPLRFEVVR